MNIFKYPFPARKLSQSQDDEMNIGFAQGVFSDGRPFHAECWASEGTTNLTFFFSTIGLENYQKRDVISYLAGEGVIELIEGKPCYCGLGVLIDDSNHAMFSATITIGNEEDLLVDSKMPIHKWDEFMEMDDTSRIFYE